MSKRHHHINMYVTTTLSITLVLILIGMEAIALLATRQLVKQVKENVSLELVLQDNADTTDLQRLYKVLDVALFCKEYTVISKEDALQEHIKYLGEDPTQFIDYNPLHASIVVALNEQYAHQDSITQIENKLRNFTSIEKIEYPKDVVKLVNDKIGFVSVLLIAIAGILLLISIALINNTIRLTTYSKRFLIHTMKLVGATPFFIKRPILLKGFWMGIIASILAILTLSGAIYYTQTHLNIKIIELSWQNIGMVSAIILSAGLIITYFASTFAANRFIRMKYNDLYYI